MSQSMIVQFDSLEECLRFQQWIIPHLYPGTAEIDNDGILEGFIDMQDVEVSSEWTISGLGSHIEIPYPDDSDEYKNTAHFDRKGYVPDAFLVILVKKLIEKNMFNIINVWWDTSERPINGLERFKTMEPFDFNEKVARRAIEENDVPPEWALRDMKMHSKCIESFTKQVERFFKSN